MVITPFITSRGPPSRWCFFHNVWESCTPNHLGKWWSQFCLAKKKGFHWQNGQKTRHKNRRHVLDFLTAPPKEVHPNIADQLALSTPPPKFNSSPQKSYQNPIGKASSNFQPQFFRGKLLNFGGCIFNLKLHETERLPGTLQPVWVGLHSWHHLAGASVWFQLMFFPKRNL